MPKYEILNDNLLDKLKERGVIGNYAFSMCPDVIYENVLDFKLCDECHWQFNINDILNFVKTTNGELPEYYQNEQNIINLQKCVLQENNNHITYISRRRYKDYPIYYISRALPNEVIKYTVESLYEKRTYIIKNGEKICPNGKKMQGILPHLNKNLIHKVPQNDNQLNIKLPWELNEFVGIYVDKENVLPYNYDENSNYVDVYLDKELLTLYTKNGKCDISIDFLRQKYINAKKAYLEGYQTDKDNIEDERDL